MDHEKQFAEELQTLRALCDEAASPGARQQLLSSLRDRVFLEPEHQVVLESIRSLLPRGGLSPSQLGVHLTKRGFPDIDVKIYFQTAPARATTGNGPERA